jgi:hypothetical protein
MRKSFVLSLIVLAAQPAAAQDFRWSGPLASGKTLEVRGINGAIHATPASGREALVTATKRSRKSDPTGVEIKVVEHPGGVTICAVYPARRAGRPNECQPGGGGRNDSRDNDVDVEFEVRVPAGVTFEGTTVNGDVRADNLPGDASLATVNGDVDVSAAGTARGSTVNGSIDARLGRADWTGSLKFSTVNGGITVTLPTGTGTDIEAATVNGSIDSDFPITVQGRVNPRSMRGRIGAGGRSLDLNTVNGSIRLREGA